MKKPGTTPKTETAKKTIKKTVKKTVARKTSKASTEFDNPETFFSLLGEAIARDIGLDPGLLAEETATELFSEYLEECKSNNLANDEKDDLNADLFEKLSDLRIAANSGDRRAREEVQEIYHLLDDELDEKSLPLTDILMIGKIFTDAGWKIPEKLRLSAAEAFESFDPSTHKVKDGDIGSPLGDILGHAKESPFEAYDFMVSMLASFPVEHCQRLLEELILERDKILNRSLVGFFLHPDTALCHSVARGLLQTASREANESLMIETLLRIRPWVPDNRQGLLDEVIKAMRQNVLPPVRTKSLKIIKAYASACDGVGCMTIMATFRGDKTYHLCSIMIKSTGVSDVLFLQDIPKAQMDMIVRELKSSILTKEINIEGIRRLLAISVAANYVSDQLPPFRLVEACEVMEIGSLPPDMSSPSDICSQLLSELPPDERDEKACNKAHQAVMDSELLDNWFEAGEELENILYPVKGKAKRVEKVLKNYLPSRRGFWSRQCALSAIALLGDNNTYRSNPLWKQLALVGRDIASDVPLDQIPLMKKIAALTVEAFEYQNRN